MNCKSKLEKQYGQLLLIGYEQGGKYRHLGTAFLISSAGDIVTAGHVFEKYHIGEIPLSKYYCAFPDEKSELIAIQSVYVEYKQRNNQKDNVFKDLAFAKINLLTDIFFEFETHRPKIGERVVMEGLVNDKAIVYIMEKFSILKNIITFLPVGNVYIYLLPIGLAMGIGIGFLGSYFTVRKHLRV